MVEQRDPFMRRLLVVTWTVFLIVLLWQLAPTLQRMLVNLTAEPRAGTARGDLAGDVIVAVDARPVTSVAELFARLNAYRVGDRVVLRVLRQGVEEDISVLLQGGA